MADVYLEVTDKKVFAASLDWPGWGRFGKTEDEALSTLAEYGARYAPIAEAAGYSFPAAPTFKVVERVPGTGATQFGVPEAHPEVDNRAVTKAVATRQAKLLTAAWDAFAAFSADAPESLRKGPRGGGRDRDKMIDHVIAAEAIYARKIGLKPAQPAIDDAAAITAMHEEILAVLGRPSDGSPLRENGWTSRYTTRRYAWHALDHLWEMQDRAE